MKREENAKTQEENKISSDSDSDKEDDDKDSIFGDDENPQKAGGTCYLEDTQKANRTIAAGNKVKLQITDV